ncbi:MAG TPA: MBL fold metallo-hydrolase [Geminicoccaceae bacterium]|nr:MBL fold metallo-hydrolase [Geminicoccaceae bacterium]
MPHPASVPALGRCRRPTVLGTAFPLLWAALALAWSGAASAAGCFPTAWLGGRALPAGWQSAAVPAGATLQLTFLGHSSFLIETAGGAAAVTDYNGYIRPPLVPDIVTMNNAHSTHFTDRVDPGVRYVLRGWNPAGGHAEHDVQHLDLRVRNVPTAVHGRTGDQALSNSIFVFETPDLCIAHLGHLHHVLLDSQVAELGQIDILLVPVDGQYTMSQEEMAQVIDQIAPAVIVPMHYFGPATLARFLARLEERWEVVTSESATRTFSRATLPWRQVLVLPGH